jgi:hypothetical protein
MKIRIDPMPPSIFAWESPAIPRHHSRLRI